MDDKVTICLAIKSSLPRIGCFLRMLSLSRFSTAIQKSLSMVCLGGKNSRCTIPTVSKKRMAIVFLTALFLIAFLGHATPFVRHSKESCLVSGSKTLNQDSSIVMTFSRRDVSAFSLSRFCLHNSILCIFCSSVSRCGTNFGLTFDIFMSFLRSL